MKTQTNFSRAGEYNGAVLQPSSGDLLNAPCSEITGVASLPDPARSGGRTSAGVAADHRSALRQQGEAVTRILTVTAYCHCAICCGEARRPTASGVVPRAGVTCAGPRRMAFGTRLLIPGIGWRVVEDRTAPEFDGRIDIFMTSHKRAMRFGVKQLAVRQSPPGHNIKPLRNKGIR